MFVYLSGVRMDGDPIEWSPDLTRYVRTEYGDKSPHWLVSEALRPRTKVSRSLRKGLDTLLKPPRVVEQCPSPP